MQNNLMKKIYLFLILIPLSQISFSDCSPLESEGKMLSIEVDNIYLQIGQYICIQSKRSMSKIDIPEHWKVSKVQEVDGDLIIELKGGFKLSVDSSKRGDLDFEILEKGPGVGALPDDVLEKIWRKYAD